VAHHSQGPATGDLALISVPVVVGIGGFDVADFQAIARRYVAEIPHATLVEFATAGHLIALDAPAELTAALDAFLAR
jgi:pimeloyl-ACP methyl ester carboxylesterase